MQAIRQQRSRFNCLNKGSLYGLPYLNLLLTSLKYMITIFIKKLSPAILLLTLFGLIAKAQDSVVTLHIDLAKQYQRIDNFAASDAWSTQFIGNWPAEKKNKIADL